MPRAPANPLNKKFFRIKANWESNIDDDLIPDWLEFASLMNGDNTTSSSGGNSNFDIPQPFEGDANNDGYKDGFNLDSDHDFTPDLADAEPLNSSINWERTPTCRYAMFSLPTPMPSLGDYQNAEDYRYPNQINSKGRVLYPRGLWHNGTHTAIPFSAEQLNDTARTSSINDSDVIVGQGVNYNTVAFIMASPTAAPARILVPQEHYSIGAYAPLISNITNEGKFLALPHFTDIAQGQNVPNFATEPYLFTMHGNATSIPASDGCTNYADPGFFIANLGFTTLIDGLGEHAILAGGYDTISPCPQASSYLLTGRRDAYIKINNAAWSVVQRYKGIKALSTIGVAHYGDKGDIRINGNDYHAADYAPELNKNLAITHMATQGHLLCREQQDASNVYAGFPIHITDNEFATGVDTTSCSVKNQEEGYEQKIWLMAPQGTWINSGGSGDNSNAFTFFMPLHEGTATLSMDNATVNVQTISGMGSTIELHGTGTSSTDANLKLTLGGQSQCLSYPVGIKSMKRRTVKIMVHPIASQIPGKADNPPDFVPSKEEFTDHFNAVFGKQINAYFEVTIGPVESIAFDVGSAASFPPIFPPSDAPIAGNGRLDKRAWSQPEVSLATVNRPAGYDIHVYIIGGGSPFTNYGSRYDSETKVDVTEKLREQLIGEAELFGGNYCIVDGDMDGIYDNNDRIPARFRTLSSVLDITAHEIGHILCGSGHPDEGSGVAPLNGSDVTKQLMCSGPFRRENSRLLVKAEWDKAEEWLRLVPDERKRKELGLQTIEEVGNY